MLDPKPGKFYIDGNGNVHGPLREHPSMPDQFLIAVGATYYRGSGHDVSADLSPDHVNLNLVQEVSVTPCV